MICPICGFAKTRVVDTDTGAVSTGGYIRRRRECCECNGRFSTKETVMVGTAVDKHGDRVDAVRKTLPDIKSALSSPVEYRYINLIHKEN